MIKLLNSLRVFKIILKILSTISRTKKLNSIIHKTTEFLAFLNMKINKHQPQKNVQNLAKTWINMMPSDSEHLFKIEKLTNDTAYVQIHLECPLKNLDDTRACHNLMNYDRSLMKSVGGNLIVLESQTSSGKNYCRLAIRKINDDVSDLKPAYKE